MREGRKCGLRARSAEASSEGDGHLVGSRLLLGTALGHRSQGGHQLATEEERRERRRGEVDKEGRRQKKRVITTDAAKRVRRGHERRPQKPRGRCSACTAAIPVVSNLTSSDRSTPSFDLSQGGGGAQAKTRSYEHATDRQRARNIITASAEN